MRHRSPADLAQSVKSTLLKRFSRSPDLRVLTELFELMYFASLRTEESQPITFHVVYLDPRNPDPDPPQRPPGDRWNCIKLDKRVPANIPNLIKTAKAS